MALLFAVGGYELFAEIGYASLNAFGVREDSGAGDEGGGAGFEGGSDGLGLDAAVYRDVDAVVGVGGLHHRECFADLGQGVGKEVLAAEPGFDGHHQYPPDPVGHRPECRDGGPGTDRHGGFGTGFEDDVDGLIHVGDSFEVNGDDIATSFGQRLDEMFE